VGEFATLGEVAERVTTERATKRTRNSTEKPSVPGTGSRADRRVGRVPRDVQYATIVTNLAHFLRTNAAEEGLSVEAYTAKVIATLSDDPDNVVLALSALCLVAAQDEYRGGGPRRLHAGTLERYGTSQSEAAR